MKLEASSTWLPLAGIVALWTPAMIAASYEWSHGVYYDYGWVVPPVAVWLLFRRWKDQPGPVGLANPMVTWVVCLLLLPWFTGLRVLGEADPSWRLPIVVSGLTAAVLSHALIAKTRGLPESREFLWISLFLFSALPLPSSVETRVVHALTRGVVAIASELFQMAGKPVEASGERLLLNGLSVEVTEGCSGVRSFQTFMMATWLFAELQRLRWGRGLILFAFAVGIAFLVNVSRATALAHIRFSMGEGEFKRAHDELGLIAFVVSAALFYFFSGILGESTKRKLVKSVQVR